MKLINLELICQKHHPIKVQEKIQTMLKMDRISNFFK